MWSIVVHGGAGAIPGPMEAVHRRGCAAAAEAGAEVLAEGGAALDAVCAAVRVLESDPAFNAGVGAALDERGLPAVDAAVMRGADLAFGAVGAVVGPRFPVEAARAVLEDGRACLLVGSEAGDFLRRAGLEMASPERFVTPATRAAHERGLARRAAGEDALDLVAANVGLPSSTRGDTVGAAARDRDGHLAAAASTGGLGMRLAGRVGDSPLPGAGTYASDALGAVSATGHGETMMRTVFAHRALLDLVGVPEGEGEAALLGTLEDARRKIGGRGGLVVVRPSGAILHARNTRGMGVAWRDGSGGAGTGF